MAPLPVEEDEYRIKTRAIHSLFHRFQNDEGYRLCQLSIQIIWMKRRHRLWIKLEWKALRKALNSEGEDTSACNKGCSDLQRFKQGALS